MKNIIQSSVDRVFGGVSAIQKHTVNGKILKNGLTFIYLSELRKFSNAIEDCDSALKSCYIVELRFTIDTTSKMVNGKNLDMSLRSGIELLQGKLHTKTKKFFACLHII